MIGTNQKRLVCKYFQLNVQKPHLWHACRACAKLRSEHPVYKYGNVTALIRQPEILTAHLTQANYVMATAQPVNSRKSVRPKSLTRAQNSPVPVDRTQQQNRDGVIAPTTQPKPFQRRVSESHAQQAAVQEFQSANQQLQNLVEVTSRHQEAASPQQVVHLGSSTDDLHLSSQPPIRLTSQRFSQPSAIKAETAHFQQQASFSGRPHQQASALSQTLRQSFRQYLASLRPSIQPSSHQTSFNSPVPTSLVRYQQRRYYTKEDFDDFSNSVLQNYQQLEEFGKDDLKNLQNESKKYFLNRQMHFRYKYQQFQSSFDLQDVLEKILSSFLDIEDRLKECENQPKSMQLLGDIYVYLVRRRLLIDVVKLLVDLHKQYQEDQNKTHRGFFFLASVLILILNKTPQQEKQSQILKHLQDSQKTDELFEITCFALPKEVYVLSQQIAKLKEFAKAANRINNCFYQEQDSKASEPLLSSVKQPQDKSLQHALEILDSTSKKVAFLPTWYEQAYASTDIAGNIYLCRDYFPPLFSSIKKDKFDDQKQYYQKVVMTSISFLHEVGHVKRIESSMNSDGTYNPLNRSPENLGCEAGRALEKEVFCGVVEYTDLAKINCQLIVEVCRQEKGVPTEEFKRLKRCMRTKESLSQHLQQMRKQTDQSTRAGDDSSRAMSWCII